MTPSANRPNLQSLQSPRRAACVFPLSNSRPPLFAYLNCCILLFVINVIFSDPLSFLSTTNLLCSVRSDYGLHTCVSEYDLSASVQQGVAMDNICQRLYECFEHWSATGANWRHWSFLSTQARAGFDSHSINSIANALAPLVRRGLTHVEFPFATRWPESVANNVTPAACEREWTAFIVQITGQSEKHEEEAWQEEALFAAAETASTAARQWYERWREEDGFRDPYCDSQISRAFQSRRIASSSSTVD